MFVHEIHWRGCLLHAHLRRLSPAHSQRGRRADLFLVREGHILVRSKGVCPFSLSLSADNLHSNGGKQTPNFQYHKQFLASAPLPAPLLRLVRFVQIIGPVVPNLHTILAARALSAEEPRAKRNIEPVERERVYTSKGGGGSRRGRSQMRNRTS